MGVLLVALFVVLPKGYAADSSWLGRNITLNEEKTYTLPQDISVLDSIGTNSVDCTNKQIKINFTQSTTACMYNMGLGYYGGGYLLFGNASIAGTIKSQMSTSSKLIFTNDQKIIELVSASGGYRVYVYDSYAGITTSKQANGSITYTLPSNPRLIKYSDGSTLLVNYNTFKLSGNSSWAVADTFGYIGFVRINIATGEVYSFTDTLNDYYSLNAISDNGSLASLSTQAPAKRLLVYDLTNCTQQSILVNRCKSADVLQKILVQKPNFYSVVHAPNFINDSLLEIYGTYDRASPSNRKIGVFTVSSDGQSLTKTNYLALGDSFSSGEGIGNYRPETNMADNRCHQSTGSYGYLLHETLQGLGAFGSVACSGAKIPDVTTSNQTDYNSKYRQSKNKEATAFNTEIYDNFLPGYRIQSNFVDKNKPKIITMSMGGNDVGFSDILKKCVLSYGYNDCYPTYEDRKELVNLINNQYSRLRDMYQSLKKEAAPDAKIYIVGYPQIAKSGGNCALNVHFSEDEIVFGNQLVSYLNYVIKSAANDSGVFYVDTEHSFDDHRLCETKSSDVAVNGLSIGNGGPVNGVGPIAKESYHPNALGHQLFANTISQSTNGLTAAMPAGNPTAKLSILGDSDIPLLVNAPHANRTLKNLQYAQNITTEVALRSALLTIQIAQPFVFKPLSSVNISIHSDPTQLGTFTTDQNGNFENTVTIPESLPVGYHTLYIEGKNMADEDIALTDIIYVAASNEDTDGNGVVDSQQSCVGVTQSGIDVDKDGLDDACDSFIDQAPPEPDPVPEPTPLPEAPPTDETNPPQPTDNPQDTSNPQDQNNQPPEDSPVDVTPPVTTEIPITPPPETTPPEKLNDIPPNTQQNNVITPQVETSTNPTNQTVKQTSVNIQQTPAVAPPTNQNIPSNTNQDITKVAGVSTPGTTPQQSGYKSKNWGLWVIILGFSAVVILGLVIFTRKRTD